jgi:hypothetical protein
VQLPTASPSSSDLLRVSPEAGSQMVPASPEGPCSIRMNSRQEHAVSLPVLSIPATVMQHVRHVTAPCCHASLWWRWSISSTRQHCQGQCDALVQTAISAPTMTPASFGYHYRLQQCKPRPSLMYGADPVCCMPQHRSSLNTTHNAHYSTHQDHAKPAM